MQKKIGFIGQGYVGKGYADDFERRDFSVVRYALEEPYMRNKEKIADCEVVFIAVPTPTTQKGFDGSIVQSVLALIGEGKVAVIKSTILPGTTKELQKQYPRINLLFSPEFLSEKTAAQDAANPFANIIGVPMRDERHDGAAAYVHSILPKAPFTLTCDSDEAEIIKYAHNISGYTQIITFNLIYDVARALGHDWSNIGKAIAADPFVSGYYANPVHKSGRGAGGHCFIKDFAAFSEVYKKYAKDEEGMNALRAFEEKNKKLLTQSEKNLDILKEVYGEE